MDRTEHTAAIGADDPRQLNRLRWRCRRGMRELDVLLQRYLERDYPSASSVERGHFEQLLELQDPDLAAYLLAGAEAPSSELASLFARIRKH